MHPTELLSASEWARFRDGDKVVFRKIYDACFGVVDYTVRRCGIVDDSGQDIVQETFLKLYNHRQRIDNGMAIKSWLITSARNLSIDYLRRQKNENRRIRSTNPSEALHTDESAQSVRHELEVLLIGDLIEDVVRDSKDDTFSLFYKDGLSAQAIASQRNESVGTVTNRLSRLRKKFNEKFKRKLLEIRNSDVD